MQETDARPEERAENFVDKIESYVKAQEGLIYEIESEVLDPSVISTRTLGNKHVRILVRLYNVSKPDDTFDADGWLYLGSLGANVDMGYGRYDDDHECYLRIEKDFES